MLHPLVLNHTHIRHTIQLPTFIGCAILVQFLTHGKNHELMLITYYPNCTTGPSGIIKIRVVIYQSVNGAIGGVVSGCVQCGVGLVVW